jgi:hypothetical protein
MAQIRGKVRTGDHIWVCRLGDVTDMLDLEYAPIPPLTAVMAIDPGLNGTGWALWIGTRLVPTGVGVLRKKHDTFVHNADWLADELVRVMIRRNDSTNAGNSALRGTALNVVCEFPEYQTGADRTMGWMRGDLQKLTYLVGVIARATYHHGATFEPVAVSKWKGQLPKQIVTDRIRQKIGRAACDRLGIKTHAWDATGIGLWRLGHTL